MMRWSLSQLAGVTGGSLLGEDRPFDRVSTDTRSLRRGDLFVAIKGPNFDGHRFVADAFHAGACGALVDQPVHDAPGPLVQVDDTVAALGRFAADWRHVLEGPLVAVTGSNGKTTVRSLVAAILSAHWPGRVLSTRGNFNNEIGVPLTLLRLTREDRAAVVEMGANHHGEIDRLTRIASPDVGLITNAAAAHLEGFGDLDGVARAKGELIKGLPGHATAILNADDPRVDVWREYAGNRRRLEFGVHGGDVRPADDCEHGLDGHRGTLNTPDGKVALRLALPGKHNLMNALAATTVGVALGVPAATITRGLATVRAEPGRMEVVNGLSGSVLVNDCYNANPDSLAAALAWLREQPEPRWLVLGDMGELGENAVEAHREAGRSAREAGVDRLFAVGPLAVEAADAFGQGAGHFARPERLIAQLQAELRPGVTVLVKASRSMGLERVVDSLRGGPEQVARKGG